MRADTPFYFGLFIYFEGTLILLKVFTNNSPQYLIVNIVYFVLALTLKKSQTNEVCDSEMLS